jgi:hypothetical protein
MSPRASGLRKRCFWSALPKAIRMEHTGQLLTLTTVLVAPSPAAISSRISASAR